MNTNLKLKTSVFIWKVFIWPIVLNHKLVVVIVTRDTPRGKSTWSWNKYEKVEKFLIFFTKFFCLPSTTVTFIILVLKRIFLSFHQLDTFLHTLQQGIYIPFLYFQFYSFTLSVKDMDTVYTVCGRICLQFVQFSTLEII